MTDFDFSKFNVLLCDTDPEVMDIVRSAYMEAGIGDFVATPSPKEALSSLANIKPDLILISLKLPEITGIEVVQKIRSMNDGQFYKTPILMLLEKVSQNLLREACRAGIEGAVRKPISQDKLLRFSRAVLLKPRRFICVRHYFGPERRMQADPHFDGTDRRQNPDDAIYSTNEFTRGASAPAGGGSSGGGSTRAGVVMSGGSQSNSSGSSTSSPDWGTTEDRPKKDGGVMDFGAPTSDTKPSNGDYDLTETAADKSKGNDYDFTSEDKAKAKSDDIEVGNSEKNKKKPQDIEAAVEKKQEAKPSDPEPEKESAAKEEEIEVEPTGPDSDDFEEVIDLEECLELHKQWVNSGGKAGQQAQRPNSDFRGQELAEADFTRAILPQSNFEEVDCSRTVFRKADLSGSTFKNALLTSADMRVSRLNKADMRNARIDKANFLGADLSGANLEGATLRSVNLSGANLHLTNLRGVNLASVQGLIPEQVKRAITDQTTRLPVNVKSRTAS